MTTRNNGCFCNNEVHVKHGVNKGPGRVNREWGVNGYNPEKLSWAIIPSQGKNKDKTRWIKEGQLCDAFERPQSTFEAIVQYHWFIHDKMDQLASKCSELLGLEDKDLQKLADMFLAKLHEAHALQEKKGPMANWKKTPFKKLGGDDHMKCS